MPRTSQFKDEEFITDLKKRAEKEVPGSNPVVVRTVQGSLGLGFPLPNGDVFVARSQDDLGVIGMAYMFAQPNTDDNEERFDNQNSDVPASEKVGVK